MNELVKFDTPELLAVEPSKAVLIKAAFEPMVQMLEAFEEKYNSVISESVVEITNEVSAKAKRLRLDIGRVRIETGKTKDKQKENLKLEDRAIMGVHNILVWAVKEKEDKLKEIEDFAEIQEQKRREALQTERAERLSIYVEDAGHRDLAKFEDDEFEALFQMKKREYEDNIAAEKQAELDRIAKEKADAEEWERVKIENQKLRDEAKLKEKWMQEERAKGDAENKAIEEKARKERAEYEAKLQAERDERTRVEKEERIKREKLEAELKAKEDTERKAKENEAARVQTELNKGDAGKKADLIADLKALKVKYTFKSEVNRKMYIGVGISIDKIITTLKN